MFGLDDKPCCYLYHKYCDEIDNCYFKRYKLLEQENKKLLNARNHFMAENLKYFNALEEIKTQIECLQYEVTHDCFNETRCKALKEQIEFLNKINEVLQ